ncbi:MAG: exonuclease domain-containing protein [Steroidobacterales bacterium]
MDAAEPGRLPQDLVFVDLETTGGNAAYHRITEIGIVRIAAGECVEQWSSLVNPECRIPPYIEAFTGISNEMVADAPRFTDIAEDVQRRLRGAVFVAHNARFDYSFLRSEYRRIGTNFLARVLCTVKLSRRLYPDQQRHSLDAVMQRHGLTCAARHRALGDAVVLWDFWSRLRAEWPEPVLAAAVQGLLAAKTLPPQLAPGLADELPDGAGVYRFYGEDDALLYIGKSVSVRTRVLAHFAGEHHDAKEQRLARQVRRVDWRETAGELGALLLEAEWVKRQKPLYNRRLNSSAAACTIRLGEAPASGVQLVAIDALERGELADCFGLFRSPKDAKKALVDIARAQQLCLKNMGLEQGAGSCFAYQVGKCRGACVGKEALLLHGMRLQLALSALKLQAWPFPGRIALREGASCGGCEWHVLEHWAYLGTARDEDELEALAQQPVRPGFDADVYRILVRHFTTQRHLDWRGLDTGDVALRAGCR